MFDTRASIEDTDRETQVRLFPSKRAWGYISDIEIREAATPEQAVASGYPNGAPLALADAILEGFTLMRRDTTGFRTDTVEHILGRRPHTFEDWCARSIGAFRPDRND